jgi:ABC-type transport system involved in multi-copper enzyme maturation permease subunit
MNTTTFPTSQAAPRNLDLTGPAGASAWTNVGAIAGVVIKELCRRKDFYVLFVLTALITLVMGSVNIFNEGGIVRYLKEICLFLIWISSLVITITTTARQLPAERENRTLFPLLAKPVTRDHVVVGKFLGCWLASGLALGVFYLFFGIIAGAKEHVWPVLGYAQAVMLHWFMLGIVCSMALAGSIVFAAPSSNNTITFIICVGILLLGRRLNVVALGMAEPMQTIVYGIYFALPHLELFDVRDLLVHNWGTIPWHIWVGALGYAAVYTAFFLGLACVCFRRKAIH